MHPVLYRVSWHCSIKSRVAVDAVEAVEAGEAVETVEAGEAGEAGWQCSAMKTRPRDCCCCSPP